MLLSFALMMHIAHAALEVKLDNPKTTGNKTVIKLNLKNTGSDTIASVRASIYLLDAKGKMVGQSTRWILGGTKDKPSLAPDAKTTYNFVVTGSQTFAQTKFLVNRMVLKDGRLADSLKDVTIESGKTP